MKKRILSLFLAFVMAVGLLPVGVLAAEANAVWPGSGNYNTDNNQVTSTQLPDSPSYTTEKWAYALNTTLDTSGAYYAGQVVLVGDSLYATGGGKLHKVDIKTGEGSVIAESAGSISGSYYDYLCYADGVILVATQTKLEAFD
ncbi:MAG: hypothetical protein II255_00130, partial [Ruminiclostridium sp.]|nr:hypothetical protein [Ruminiclostridium sp.]